MSWVSGFECPMCGQTEFSMGVDKTPNLKDWGLVCAARYALGGEECHHHLGKGSYWLTEKGGFKGHCDRLGWDFHELMKETDDT